MFILFYCLDFYCFVVYIFPNLDWLISKELDCKKYKIDFLRILYFLFFCLIYKHMYEIHRYWCSKLPLHILTTRSKLIIISSKYFKSPSCCLSVGHMYILLKVTKVFSLSFVLSISFLVALKMSQSKQQGGPAWEKINFPLN